MLYYLYHKISHSVFVSERGGKGWHELSSTCASPVLVRTTVGFNVRGQHLFRRSHLPLAFDAYPLQPGLAYTMTIFPLEQWRWMPNCAVLLRLHAVVAEHGLRETFGP